MRWLLDSVVCSWLCLQVVQCWFCGFWVVGLEASGFVVAGWLTARFCMVVALIFCYLVGLLGLLYVARLQGYNVGLRGFGLISGVAVSVYNWFGGGSVYTIWFKFVGLLNL